MPVATTVTRIWSVISGSTPPTSTAAAEAPSDAGPCFVDLDDAMKRLTALPGIGPWTASYIAMRALREPDAFPVGDLALQRAFVRFGGVGSLAAAAETAPTPVTA